MSALGYAAIHGNIDMVRVLMQAGAAVDDIYPLNGIPRVGTPLLLAVMRGDLSMVEFLLENGADPTTPCISIQFNCAVLSCAVYRGDEDIVRVISKHLGSRRKLPIIACVVYLCCLYQYRKAVEKIRCRKLDGYDPVPNYQKHGWSIAWLREVKHD